MSSGSAQTASNRAEKRAFSFFFRFDECSALDASLRLAHEVKTISRGVSHGKSLVLSQPWPRFAVPDRGEHVWFLLNPRIRCREWKIRCDYSSFLSTRCLIYEWTLSERRFSQWRAEAPSAWPFWLKGQYTLLSGDRKSAVLRLNEG